MIPSPNVPLPSGLSNLYLFRITFPIPNYVSCIEITSLITGKAFSVEDLQSLCNGDAILLCSFLDCSRNSLHVLKLKLDIYSIHMVIYIVSSKYKNICF